MKKNKKIITLLITLTSIIVISLILYFTVFQKLDIFNTNKKEETKENKEEVKNEETKIENNLVTKEDKAIKLTLKKLKIEKGEEYKIDSFIKNCVINESEKCIYKYADEEMATYKDVGTYDIVIIASDDNKNKVKDKTTLIIVDKKENDKQEDVEKNDNDVVQSNEQNNNVSNEQNNTITTTTRNQQNNKPNNTTNSTTTTTTVQQKYVVETKTETSEEISYKYGVTIKKITNYVYQIYNDGSKDLINSYDSYSYDYSTFNATTSDMRSEASSIASNSSGIINEVLNYTNSYRAEVGVNNLTLDWTLTEAATLRALEMGWANYFEHTRPNGDSCFTIFSDYGISYWTVGENIANGYWDAASVSNGWKNSPGHYANMINSNFGRIGIGYAEVNGRKYWVQLFAN